MMKTRTKPYPEKKVRMYEKIKELARKYDCIAASSLNKVRAAQLMEIKRKFRNELVILVIKNKLAYHALKEINIHEEFLSKLTGQIALIFTNMNPFKLYLLLEKNKIDIQAKAGDIATEDIVIPAGNTGIPPGPVLSDFKAVNIPTRIDSGSIWVTKDTVVARKGEEISLKLANLLSRLGIKAIKAGLSVDFAIYDNLVLSAEQIRIDPRKYEDEIKRAVSESFMFATYVAYPAKEVIPNILAKARQEAIALAKSCSYPDAEILPYLISEALAVAKRVENLAKEKGYS